jgi:hypothetical protein
MYSLDIYKYDDMLEKKESIKFGSEILHLDVSEVN